MNSKQSFIRLSQFLKTYFLIRIGQAHLQLPSQMQPAAYPPSGEEDRFPRLDSLLGDKKLDNGAESELQRGRPKSSADAVSRKPLVLTAECTGRAAVAVVVDAKH
ncbi:hypothetical protein EVAR_51776_1 [Eumeta japonica]|uniref:Uncharacterized protein n=1 Tax=Eumeta variegata TaxID=151549 RepID=A0A4C1XD43_EUMVA|nr:hypothetical protein EVAR_51776_1 [Eumeta japonica]